jgi:hypothetical protein
LALDGITASSDTRPLRTCKIESPAASATTWWRLLAAYTE